MNSVRKIIIILFLFCALCSCMARSQDPQDTLFQVSVIKALSEGVFEGSLSCSELLQHGDFGLGTFNDLDGEMVLLDGQLYQARSDGVFLQPDRSLKIPFAAATFFRVDQSIPLKMPSDYTQIKSMLDGLLKRRNIFYAIRIDGKFSHVKIRSVPPQFKPYPDLATAIREQRVFEFLNVSGTMVGFWSPSYAGNFNAPGYHFHFIDKAHKFGGHLLDVKLVQGTASLMLITHLNVALPQTTDFDSADLQEDQQTLISEK